MNFRLKTDQKLNLMPLRLKEPLLEEKILKKKIL
jgi:hypothetical protein